MNKDLMRWCVIIGSYLAVGYPLWVRYAEISWSLDLDSILYNLFPGFGLLAFSLLWLHSISGVFEPWLRNNFNFDRFVYQTAILIFISIIAHPLLLLMLIDFKFEQLFSSASVFYIRLGLIGWLLLITYDIGKILKRKYEFFVHHWHNILLISTIGFLVTFFHSLWIGSDLQAGPLRLIWIFYGVTAILATIYTYGYKRLLKLS